MTTRSTLDMGAICLGVVLTTLPLAASIDATRSGGRPSAGGVGSPDAPNGPSLSIDVGADRHRISPLIYGVNFADTASAEELGLTLDRWGGNATTRYDYRTGLHNTGSDWFFENVPPASSSPLPHDAFIEADRDAGMKTVLTVPLIGWTPRADSPDSHPFACGFRVSRYGAQDQVDPWDPDCGNGQRGGQPITGNDPTDTSRRIGPAWVRRWVEQLVADHGRRSEGGVAVYELDNEPSLWDDTHRDVHPDPVTYDELLERTIAYARAVKAGDPSARILGPSDWGWCAYLYSPADGDGCSVGPDREAHGGRPIAAWYLSRLRAHEQSTGERLLHYFDEHYYPQSGAALRDAGDAQMRALRLRSTRSLWDPAYIDESWISDTAPGGVAVRLIPRMRGWVGTNYPGTKLAITEYNFGGLESLNGALTQADVLGIFGREGLDLAALWAASGSDEPWAFAFRTFRDYDGAGHRFGETSVRALSVDPAQPDRPNGGQDRLSVYAAERASDGALTVLVINKTAGALTSALDIDGFSARSPAQIWRYSGADLTSIVREPDVAVTGGAMTVTYPASSITLLMLREG